MALIRRQHAAEPEELPVLLALVALVAALIGFAVGRYLAPHSAAGDSLSNVPFDDEEMTPAEAAAAAEGRAAVQRGDVMAWEEARRMWGAENSASAPL